VREVEEVAVDTQHERAVGAQEAARALNQYAALVWHQQIVCVEIASRQLCQGIQHLDHSSELIWIQRLSTTLSADLSQKGHQVLGAAAASSASVLVILC
jgi:hypothetical protein